MDSTAESRMKETIFKKLWLKFIKAWITENKKLDIITHICRIKGCGGAGWPPHQ